MTGYAGGMRYAMILLGLVSLLGFGCAAPDGPTQMDVPAGRYAVTFDAARRVLRDARFDLERVDAKEGVITTDPKHSAGLMTLWDEEQSTAGQEVDDLMENQRREVRVTFEALHLEGAEVSSPPTAPDEPIDLVAGDQATRMSVRVVVLRDYKPGWQVQTSSIRLSTHTYDPALGRRGMLPDYETAVSEDRALAARIVKWIEKEAGKAQE